MADNDASGKGFTADEKKAMKERAAELRAEKSAQRKADKAAAAEQQLLDKIAELPDQDRELAEGIHAIIKESAPQLQGKTWYGMPAYANSDDKIVVFFQAASKFGVRYATLGFNEDALLDEGTMWPTAFALTSLTDADTERIADLVRRAVG